jgi:hypothetical protein
MGAVIVVDVEPRRQGVRTRRTTAGEIPYEEMGLADRTTGETPFAEVVIGPIARSPTSVAEIRNLLDRNGLEDVSIRTSAVPLRH